MYKPYGENLYYYDVNSLYPFASLNDMPSLNCNYEDFMGNNPDLSSLFGVYYCKAGASDNYLSLLPNITETGVLVLL